MPRPHFSILGFPVQVQTSALLIGAYITYQLGMVGIYFILALFCSILLHEVGHALAFRRYGCDAAISLHLFGGSTSSYGGPGLTDRQHVHISFAGPLIQIVALGIPSATLFYLSAANPSMVLYLDMRWHLQVMMLINIALPLFNLLPIHPLDGGQILFHTLRLRKSADPWKSTVRVTQVVGAIVAGILVWAGYVFGAVMIGFFVYRAMNMQRSTGQAPSRIQVAASRANADHRQATAAKPDKDVMLVEAYERMLDGNTNRLGDLAQLLTDAGATDELVTLRAWQAVFAGEQVASNSTSSGLFASTVAMVASGDVEYSSIAAHLSASLTSPELPAAIALLHKRAQLETALAPVTDELVNDIREVLVRCGLPQEQMAVSRIIRLRSEAAATSAAEQP